MGLIGPRYRMYAEALAAFVGAMHGPELARMGEPAPEIAPPLPKILHFSYLPKLSRRIPERNQITQRMPVN